MPKLKPAAFKVLLLIVRKTYGWQKVSDRIGLTTIQRATGLSREGVIRGIKDLRGLITVKPGRKELKEPNEYSLNLDISTGELVNRVDQSENLTSQNSPLLTSQQSRHSETYCKKKPKRAIDNPTNPEEGFNLFWKSYPIKTGKGAALRAWNKLKPNSETQAKIEAAIKAQIRWREERAGDPKLFTPGWKHPTTWLNAMAWEDEVEEIRENTKAKILFHCNRCGTSHPEEEHTK